MVFKWRRLKEISVYHQHTVGVRGHALLWSGLCVRCGKVYNKCTMFQVCSKHFDNLSVANSIFSVNTDGTTVSMISSLQ